MAQTVTKRVRLSRIRPSRHSAKTRKLNKLLDAWLADESGYDERVWPIIKKAIEENRMSNRSRFSD